MSDQVPFGALAEFAENPEPRCPCILLLDTSTSMSGDPIRQLNAGLQSFKDELCSDSLASKRVEVAIVTFGPAQVALDFQTADSFQPFALEANGDTPMGEAIEKAIQIVSDRKDIYRLNGITYYRPWIFMITDGTPTDDVSNAIRLIADGEKKKAFMFFSVGVQNADMTRLKSLSPTRDPLKLDGLKFKELFSWLSNSLGGVSRSRPDETPALPSPVSGPTGWAIAG